MENVMKFRWALYKTKVKTKSNDPFYNRDVIHFVVILSDYTGLEFNVWCTVGVQFLC